MKTAAPSPFHASTSLPPPFPSPPSHFPLPSKLRSRCYPHYFAFPSPLRATFKLPPPFPHHCLAYRFPATAPDICPFESSIYETKLRWLIGWAQMDHVFLPRHCIPVISFPLLTLRLTAKKMSLRLPACYRGMEQVCLWRWHLQHLLWGTGNVWSIWVLSSLWRGASLYRIKKCLKVHWSSHCWFGFWFRVGAIL